jgi:adenine-specific DNA methylase
MTSRRSETPTENLIREALEVAEIRLKETRQDAANEQRLAVQAAVDQGDARLREAEASFNARLEKAEASFNVQLQRAEALFNTQLQRAELRYNRLWDQVMDSIRGDAAGSNSQG